MAASHKPVEDPAFDPKFLDTYTGGDKAIRNQVLELFLEQASLLLDRLYEARGDAKAWHAAAHSLKGCAGGVGASGVADLARLAEQRSAETDDIHIKTIRDLRSALAATAEKVREVLAS